MLLLIISILFVGTFAFQSLKSPRFVNNGLLMGVKYDKSKYAPLKEQVLVVTLLLWAYTWAVGDAGFGKVWQDGNNEDDLKAWGTRIRQRIKKFANDSEAHIVLAHALGMHNASFSHQNEILDQIKSFIEIGIQEKVWTENDQNKNNELISKDYKKIQ